MNSQLKSYLIFICKKYKSIIKIKKKMLIQKDENKNICKVMLSLAQIFLFQMLKIYS